MSLRVFSGFLNVVQSLPSSLLNPTSVNTFRNILQKNYTTTVRMAQENIQALVVCGPSGSGKSTLIQRLFREYPDKFGFSVSHTTRTPREREINGVHYHFITKEEMEEAIKNGEFIETAVYSNNIYGTSKKAVENITKEGKLCVLDIDVQGVKQLKKTDLKILYVFIKPSSIEVLAKRLKGRGTESNETLEMRLRAAEEEIKYGDSPNTFDLVIINENLDEAYAILKDFIFEQLSIYNKHGDAAQS